MSEPIQLPDDAATVALPGGQTFRLDLVEACRAINDIARKCREDATENYEHVVRFQAWVKDAAGVDLTLAQADALMDRVQYEYAAQKKAARERLNSLSSTGPAPADSPTDFD